MHSSPARTQVENEETGQTKWRYIPLCCKQLADMRVIALGVYFTQDSSTHLAAASVPTALALLPDSWKEGTEQLTKIKSSTKRWSTVPDIQQHKRQCISVSSSRDEPASPANTPASTNTAVPAAPANVPASTDTVILAPAGTPAAGMMLPPAASTQQGFAVPTPITSGSSGKGSRGSGSQGRLLQPALHGGYPGAIRHIYTAIKEEIQNAGRLCLSKEHKQLLYSTTKEMLASHFEFFRAREVAAEVEERLADLSADELTRLLELPELAKKGSGG